MSEPFRAESVVYLRPNRVLALSPFALAAAPLVFVAAILARVPLAAAASPLLLIAGVVGTLTGWLVNRWPGRVTGALVAGPEGVFLDGKRLATRREIKAGLVVPQGLGPPMVRLERRRRRPLDLVIDDEAQGRALLVALGLDASQTVATFRTPSRAITDKAYRIPFILGIVGMAFLGGLIETMTSHGHRGSPAGLLVRLVLIAAIIALTTLTRGRIDVGADGILTSWLGLKKRFIPYREIAGVESYIDTSRSGRYRYRGVSITTTARESIRIPITQVAALDSSNQINAVVERVREAMATYQRGEATASAAMLDRGERSERDWIRALRAVGSGAAADHRTAPVLPEQLWRIVEDPSQTPELRAGAAVVLGGSLGEEGRARLRIAAGAVAEPKVRVAIEAAGGDDEEALVEALADLPRDARARAT